MQQIAQNIFNLSQFLEIIKIYKNMNINTGKHDYYYGTDIYKYA